MRDFWISSGHHLLDRNAGGGLVLTDDFLKLYFARPELIPPKDACDAERTLYVRLMAAPRRSVASREVSAIKDSDARENWQLFLAFREHLVRHSTLEAAYTDLIRSGTAQKTPPLFINQLVHVILRNALDGCEDAEVLRAGELFFRTQRVTLHESNLIAADEEKIGGTSTTRASPLVSMLGIPTEANIDVLTLENAEHYWHQSDQFDMAINLTAGRSGLTALAQAITAWVHHLLGIEVEIEALPALRDVSFNWYVGLDADATKIGDMVWNEGELDEASVGRIVGLFRLTFRDPAVALERLRGEPVYLILAMSADKLIRMKPQNLITGLPVRHLEAVT
jgi:uncharacterized protein DUF6352